MSHVAVYAYSLAVLLHALFGLYLFLSWRGAQTGGVLLTAVGASGVWAALNLWAAVTNGDAALLLALVGETLRSAAWLFLLVVLLRSVAPSKSRALGLVAVAVVGAQVFGLALAVAGSETGRTLALAGFLAGAVFALVLVEQLYRDVPAASRWGVKPLCLGLVAVHVFELYFFADGVLFSRLDPDVWSVRGVVHAMAIPLIALSAARVPSWTLKITVSREVAFHSTALALSGMYLLFIAAVGYYVRYIGGDWGRAVQLALLVAGLLVLGGVLLSGAQRARLKVFLNKHFFPYRYDYRTEWLRFTHALSASGDSADLGQAVIKALGDLVESSGGYLWLKGAQGEYLPYARLNRPVFEAAEPQGSAFSAFLDEHEWIVDLEEARAMRSSMPECELPAWLERVPDAWLVIPLKSGSGLIGFVVLATARTPFEVDWEVRDLLKSAARQAASYLARMQAAEALLEAGKFDSFNRMSAFVVHDLKNLVAQMALMLKNAERHRDNPEFQQDMIDMVTHVESRMRSLMGQLQEKTSIEPRRKVALPGVLERVIESKRLQSPGVQLQLDSGGDVTVDAHPEKLERVVGHIVQNALDACNSDGNVTARLEHGATGRICVVVEDSGCGMTKEFIRDHLFRPFSSSKRNGMGIGMYEAQQYVQELGGSIDVESEPGMGTRVTISLPCRPKTSSAPH